MIGSTTLATTSPTSPEIGCQRSVSGARGVDQDERDLGGGGDVAERPLGLLVALLVDRQHGGAVRERSGGDDPQRAGGLAGAGPAAGEDVLPLAAREPRSVELAGHRHVRLGVRPGALADDLSLRADVDALPGRARWRGLPRPAPRELVVAQLLAGAEVSQPPATSEQRAGGRRGGERSDDEQRTPPAREHGEAAQQRSRRGCEIEVANREHRSPSHQPRACRADRGADPECGKARGERDHAATRVVCVRIASSSSIRVAFAGRPASRLNSRTRSARCWLPHT